MTLKEFLKLNSDEGNLDICLHLNNKIIDYYSKEELENSIYVDKEFESFQVVCNDLYIYLKDF